MTTQTKFNYHKRRIEELEYNIELLELMIVDSGAREGDVAYKVIQSMRDELMELILLGDEEDEH